MFREFLENYLHLCSYSDYLEPFVLICIIIALLTEIKFLKSNPSISPFFVYTCAAFILFFGTDISFTINYPVSNFFIEGFNILFALLEYIVFWFYFRRVLSHPFSKKVTTLPIGLLIASIIFYFYRGLSVGTTDVITKKLPDFIISFELLLLAIPCLVYYYKLLKNKPTNELSERPSFWIVTGLFLYSITIIPSFIIASDLLQINKVLHHAAFAVHYILLGLLFLGITRAVLCKKPLET